MGSEVIPCPAYIIVKLVVLTFVQFTVHKQTMNLLFKTCRLRPQGIITVDNLFPRLKGHGNEADFLGFLHKLVPHRFITRPFEPFQFWLRIRGDIRN
jgi:hypothetical protein